LDRRTIIPAPGSYREALEESLSVISRFSSKEVREDSRLMADLHLDSVEVMDLVAELEDHFGVVLPIEQLHELGTVEKMARCLWALLQEEGRRSSA